ncbi:Uncharacterized membrane protein [Gordonia malaquae]|uniref:DUF1345 domain-containing protein n=1 Tax=Gordonia malaquae NBRC 108250 TaxID=1223542 RepID=M3UT28_GORML|nr:DUF1345 domain-containing protein [Gordonia malaquae]GAC78462.1 hypothetical protein GM1_003_02010 [Gordonia malaquae NBRC 108250]SED39362.1 Uncharacterized membrane protein [Gordonia malaquae]
MIDRDDVAAGVATAADLIVVVLALYSLFAANFYALLAWEIAAAVYLLCTGVVIRRRVRRGTSDPRTGLLSRLSWIVPLATSLAGVNAAVVALLGQSYAEKYADSAGSAALLGVTGIVLSWLLLHVAFMHIYMSRYSESAAPALSFPEDRGPDDDDVPPREPGYPEFIYFAFTLGTTFATSDVEVRTRRMRSAVVVHSVWSFFYNALVVAVAFQVLQRFATL